MHVQRILALPVALTQLWGRLGLSYANPFLQGTDQRQVCLDSIAVARRDGDIRLLPNCTQGGPTPATNPMEFVNPPFAFFVMDEGIKVSVRLPSSPTS